MRIIISTVLIGVAAGVACSDSTSSAVGGGSTTSLTVQDNRFSPTPDTISAGQTATWTWSGTLNQHDVTFEDGIMSSAQMSSGTHQRLFSAPGTHRYRCTVHSSSFTGGMVGVVVVQ